MFRKLTKQRGIVMLCAIAALALAGGAYAFLSASGSGTGSGTVSATNSAMTLSASGSSTDSSAAIPGLSKLGDSETFYIWAGQSASPQETPTVTTTVAASSTSCPAGSFTLGSSSGSNTHQVSTAVEVPSGSGKTSIGSDKVFFNDTPTADQTACESGYSLSFSTP